MSAASSAKPAAAAAWRRQAPPRGPPAEGQVFGIKQLHPENDKIVPFKEPAGPTIKPATPWNEMHVACARGDLLTACRLQHRHRFKYKDIGGFTFQTTCSNGHAPVAKLLLEAMKPVPRETLVAGARSALLANKPQVLAVVQGEAHFTWYEVVDAQALHELGALGHLGSLQWIRDCFGDSPHMTQTGNIVSMAAIREGGLPTIQWLFGAFSHCRENRKFLIRTFYRACSYDRKDVVAWMVANFSLSLRVVKNGVTVAGHSKSRNVLACLRDVGDFLEAEASAAFLNGEQTHFSPASSPSAVSPEEQRVVSPTSA